MNPPIRGKADREALLEGLLDGTIDMIATDHAPHSAEEKSRGLGGSAFGGSWSLKRVVLPQSLTNIGYDTRLSSSVSPFLNCPNIERFEGKFASADGRILIDEIDGLKTIVSFAGGGLSSYTVPNDIKAIGNFAFYGCESLTGVTLPEGLEVLGSSCLSGTGLVSITIPSSLTMIGEGVLSYAPDLIEVVLKPTTAPSSAGGSGDFFKYCHDDLLIYVPANLLEYYQNTDPWSAYSTRYRAIE